MNTIVIKTQKELDALQRILSKTVKDKKFGCWNFSGSLSKAGYGKTYFNGKHSEVHRVVYKILNGNIRKGLDVSHDCDNPKCVNPNHLRLLTRSKNIKDAVKRGRIKAGASSPNSVLSESKIKEAARLKKSGWSNASIARMFKVSTETIRRNLLSKRNY
ncbi:MAG: HNH endonuclease [Bacteriovoracaceae bacterium]